MTYDVAGTIIASAGELPGLAPSAAANARWTLIWRALSSPEQGLPYHVWRDDKGQAWIRFFREAAGRRLVFPGVVDVLVADATGEVIVDAAPHASPRRVQQLIAHYVLPLLLGRERLVLHASAVAIDGEAIAFVGPTGCGKSTLASSLCTRGATLVADDALVVDDGAGAVAVIPYRAPLRLSADAIAQVMNADPAAFATIGDGVRAKRAVPVRTAGGAALRLARIYLLASAGRGPAHVSNVPHADAIRDLMLSAFEMAIDDPASLSRAFDRLARVVATVPVHRLRLPHGYGRLADVAGAISVGQLGPVPHS